MNSDALPTEPAEIERDEIEAFRNMTSAERGRRLKLACRGAARLFRSRSQAGFAEVEPEPWPQSTWQFLARQAADVHS